MDISWQYLNFFLEDDEKLAQIGADYKSGKMLSGEIKAELGKCLNELLKGIQETRATLTDEHVQKFFKRDKRMFMGRYLADEVGQGSEEAKGKNAKKDKVKKK